LELFLEIKLDKDQQTSNWNHRPLSLSQMMYAAYDVVYLRRLYYKIMETVPVERLPWHRELCEELEGTFYEADPDSYRKLLDWRTATEFDYFIAKRLHEWRENLAKQLNTPPASVIGNALLAEWADTPLEGYENWQKIKGLPHKLRNEYSYKNYKSMLDNARKEATEKLLKTAWTRPAPHKYFRSREDADFLKEALKAFRTFLRDKYGETVATLLLSSTQCEAMIGGKSINDIRRFAQPCVRESAAEFGLDLEKYGL
jgi:ribonuclease D